MPKMAVWLINVVCTIILIVILGMVGIPFLLATIALIFGD